MDDLEPEFTMVSRGDSQPVYLIELDDPKVPSLAASLVVDEKLQYFLSHGGGLIPQRRYSEIITTQKLETFSEVERLLIFLKDLATQKESAAASGKEFWLETAKDCLEKFVEEKEVLFGRTETGLCPLWEVPVRSH